MRQKDSDQSAQYVLVCSLHARQLADFRPVRIPGGKGVHRHNRAEVAARAVLVSGVNYCFSLVVMHASRFRTANVRNGSASEAHVRNGGAKGCGAALRREVHAVQEVQEARVGTQAARATG